MKCYTVLYLLLVFTFSACDNPPPAKDAPGKNPEKTGYSGSYLDSLDIVIAENPEDAQAYALRAKLYLAGRNVEQARNDINRALAIDSNVAEVHEAKGEMHYMLNQTRYARNEWEKCLKLDPDNSGCIMPLAELYLAVRNYDKALGLVDKQLQLNASDPQAYFMKGIIIRDKHQDTALALQYFQNAVDIKSDYVEALDMLAVTLAQKGDTLAKFYYQRILEITPNSADTYFKLGVYYMSRGEVNNALEAYTKAIQLNPSDADSYYNLGFLYVEQKQYRDAAGFFTQAIRYRDRNFRAYYGRGYAFEMMGDVIKAKEDYQKALEILPIYRPAQEALARINKAGQ